jgi:hypothetical protein
MNKYYLLHQNQLIDQGVGKPYFVHYSEFMVILVTSYLHFPVKLGLHPINIS